MKRLRSIFAGARALFRRDDNAPGIDDELRHYLELSVAERMREGMARPDAERAARLELGNVTAVKEDVHNAGWESRVGDTVDEFRRAARSLRRSPVFSITSIATLMLAIGANTAMFSVLEGLLLKPLPYRDQERLATLWTDDSRHGGTEEGTSTLNFLDWKAQSTSFIDMAVCSRGNPVMLEGPDPQRLYAEEVSANMFPLLGVEPAIGRNFTPEEEARGEVRAILSHGLWMSRFGGSSDVIGRAIQLDGHMVTIVGVMPQRFFFPTERTQLWLTANPSERERSQRTLDTWRVVGRLKPGVSFEQAQREMTAIGERLSQAYPVSDTVFAGFGVNVVPMLQQVVGTSLPNVLWLLVGAVTLVLCIASANVASLMLARNAMRAHELSIRAAIGATRDRLLGHVLVETMIIAGVGTLLGVGMAFLVTQGLATGLAADLPRATSIQISLNVLIYTAVVVGGSALAFGLWPAWNASRTGAPSTLSATARRTGLGTSHRSRRALVVVECALAVVLLCGASLVLRSLARVNAVDAGFDPGHVLLARVALPQRTTEEGEHRSPRGDERMHEIVRELRLLPGIDEAGAFRDFVFRRNPDWIVTPDGERGATTTNGELTQEYVIPGTFAALEATLLSGRDFTDADYAGPPVSVVNESFARHYFGTPDAVGKRFKEGPQHSGSPWTTVIGVVRDLRRRGVERGSLPEFYTPWMARNMDILLHVRGSPARMTAEVRASIMATAPGAAIERVTPLATEYGTTSAQRKLQTWLLTAFAGLALLMAAVGLYGLMHHTVVSRKQEIALRMALGAQRRDAWQLVVSEGFRLAMVGIGIGLIGALSLGELMSHLVFGVGPRDPLAIGLAAVVLGAAALLACAIPALTAARLDPLVALRS